MKSKNKYKLKPKYANGTSGIQQKMYTPEELKARQLAGTGVAEQGADKGVETVAGAIPIAGAFMAAGKAGYNGIRQNDAYGVAKSDAGAAVATTFAPHKTTFKELQDGNIGNAVGSLILPFGFAAKQNARLRGERDKMLQEQTAENNKLATQGSDETLAQTGQVYKNGSNGTKSTKEVLAEGGELIFKKLGNNKYKLKADLKGPSHKNGGIDVTVEKGDAIVPKKDAAKVRKMVDKYGIANNKFNSYRVRLPKDKDVAGGGGKYDELNDSLYGDNPYADEATNVYGNGTGLLTPKGMAGGVTQQLNINPRVPSTAPSVAPSVGVEETRGGGYLNAAAQLAPTLYNIGEGVFGKVEKEKANYLTPNLLKYQDSSNPLRRASDTSFRIDASNARNLSGGNAGNIRANLNQANVENFNRKQDINQAEVAQALAIQNANVGIKNQADQYNTQEKTRVQNANSQNAARKSDYLGVGLKGLSDFSQVRTIDANQADNNEQLYDALETRSYKRSTGKKGKYKTKK